MKTHTIESDARRMYSLLLDGGVALAPTRTGYGLVAMRSSAVRRIYELKGRPSEKPCVTVGSMPILDDVAAGVDPSTRSWLSRAVQLWPIAVIARLDPGSRLLASFDPFTRGQCTKDGTIATFYGVGELIGRTAELAYDHGQLIVGSSANLAGSGNNYSLDEVPDSIRSGVDVVFAHGATPQRSAEKLASTILDLPSGRFQRRGVCFPEIERSWHSFNRAHAASAAAPA